MSEADVAEPDVILFDLGGVLMDFGGLERLAELSGEDDGPGLRSRWIASEWVHAFERGGCGADAFARGVVNDWQLGLSPSEFLADFARWSAGPYAGSLELLRSLNGVVPMGCLSNTNRVQWQRHLDHWGLVQHFEWTFTSHELGIMKPDPAMFRHVIRTIGTTPDRLLFLDDSEEHVQAARASGMQAEHTQGLPEVLKALRSHFAADSRVGRALRFDPA
ncbi:HAD family hydrolase [uncultured Amnibacterium sp.]|uniref:HAD family hydrolase n=1 Tax=uncultured Amnibacterium sp. TaxID=1631851 RepID=UPI0035CBA60A